MNALDKLSRREQLIARNALITEEWLALISAGIPPQEAEDRALEQYAPELYWWRVFNRENKENIERYIFLCGRGRAEETIKDFLV